MVGIYHDGQNLDGCCSSGMSIESAIKSVDARCVHYILWEGVSGVYHTLGEGLLA